jgi:hypothetical protein
MVMAPLVLQVFQRQTHCCTDIQMTVSYHIRIRDKCVFNNTIARYVVRIGERCIHIIV